MEQLFPSTTPIKSALFVDFDNIYIGLSKTDPAAAERFASDPSRWLSWLERGLPDRSIDGAGAQRARSILVRRCYPNPDAGFRRFRSFFTSAAFSVIDCPTLTRTGKNSSDIYMVMDILDILSHKTYFDEFIIFSGDSDFMPVLLRLRAHDRRTTTLAIDFMPPAYKAACDLVISEEEFIEDALGVSHEGNCGGAGTGRARVPMTILKSMAARVYATACDEGEVAGADLPDILKDFREFRDSNNWLGFGTSQRLAEALVCCEPRLHVVRINPMMYKLLIKPQITREIFPEDIPTAAPIEKPAEAPALFPEPVIAAERAGQPERKAPRTIGRTGEKSAKTEMTKLRMQVIALVKEMVASSPTAILLARASQHVVSTLGQKILDTQWAGAGSFKRLLQGAGDLGLEITTQPEPGYIFDPHRHQHPAQREQSASASIADAAFLESQEAAQEREDEDQIAYPTNPLETDKYPMEEIPEDYDEDEEESEQEGDEDEEEDYAESLPSLEEFARRVSQVTGAPDLTDQQYALVFRGIVNELQGIAGGEKVYNTYQSSKAISDWCAEHGDAVARADVVLILKGIIFQDGVRFGKRPGSYTALELASVVRNNIKALCRRSRLELSEYENHLLDEWIMGGLEDPQNETEVLSPEMTRETDNGSPHPLQENDPEA